jgi:hypothetical protein
VHHLVEFDKRNVFKGKGKNFKTFSCHFLGNNSVEDIIFLGFSEVGLLVMVIKGFVGKLEDVLWSTFNIDSDVVSISCNLSNDSLSLQVLVKWKIAELLAILLSVNDFLMDIFVVINKEFGKGNFNFLTFWLVAEVVSLLFSNKVNIRVRDDTLANNILNFIHNFKFGSEGISVITIISDMVVKIAVLGDLIFPNGHSALGQASSLADVNLVTHGHVLN